MDEIAITIGYAVIVFAALAAFLWAVTKLPIVGRAVVILALLTWGAVGFVAVPLVAYIAQFSKGNYFAGALTLLIGGIVYVPWLLLGLPLLLHRLGLRESEYWN